MAPYPRLPYEMALLADTFAQLGFEPPRIDNGGVLSIGRFVVFPQAHVQLVSAIVDDGLDPQAALDRARFMVDGDQVLLEEGLWEREDELRAAGIDAVPSDAPFQFGGGQAILVERDVLVGGSDPRKDGYAAGF